MAKIETKPARILNFTDNKIEPLTIEELEMTGREKNYSGKPMMGMYHFDFAKAILEAVRKEGLDCDIPEMFAADNRDKTRPGASVDDEREKEYGQNDIRAYTLRRIFCEVNVKSFEDEVTSTSIAWCCNQMGWQLAFGPRVKVCKNLSILGADRFMSTYASENNMPNPGRILEVLGDWLHNFADERARDLKIMEGMQDVMADPIEVNQIVGELTALRVKKENAKDFPRQPNPPLNGAQISKFTLDYLKKKRAFDEQNKAFSIWELYNLATNMYKPGHTDMPIILSNNYSMSQYLIDRYGLN